jgi:hypothetical protein
LTHRAQARVQVDEERWMAGAEVFWSDLQPRLDALIERLDHIERYLVELGQVTGHRYAPFSTGLPPEVADLARAGKMLDAIRLYRQLTSATLDQAKLALQKATAGGIE